MWQTLVVITLFAMALLLSSRLLGNALSGSEPFGNPEAHACSRTSPRRPLRFHALMGDCDLYVGVVGTSSLSLANLQESAVFQVFSFERLMQPKIFGVAFGYLVLGEASSAALEPSYHDRCTGRCSTLFFESISLLPLLWASRLLLHWAASFLLGGLIPIHIYNISIEIYW